MKAVVLVGGQGTRLRPLTDTRPKPMMNLVDRPFVEHQIDLLAHHGVRDIVFSCGYRPDALREHFGDGTAHGVRMRYVVDPEPLGTAGAVANAGDIIGADEVLVLNGDILTDLDLGAVIAAHHARGAEATIVLTPVEDPSAYGLVRLDADQRVTEFLEKPTPDQLIPGEPFLINAGTYVLSPAAVARIPRGRASSIERETFPVIAREGGLYGYPSDAYWRDIGTHGSYLDAHADVLAGRARTQTAVNGGAHAGEGVDVHDEADVHGHTVLGGGTRVRKGARVTDSVVGAGADVGEGARVERSILGDGVRVGRDASITGLMVIGDDAVVADGARLEGPGTVPTGGRVDETGRVWPNEEVA